MTPILAPYQAKLVDFFFEEFDYCFWDIEIEAIKFRRKLVSPLVDFPGKRFIGRQISGYLVLIYATSEAVPAETQPSIIKRGQSGVVASGKVVGHYLLEDEMLPVIEAPMPVFVSIERGDENCETGDWLRVSGEFNFYPTPSWLREATDELVSLGLAKPDQWGPF